MSVSEKRLSVGSSEIEPQKRPRPEPPCNKESRPKLDPEKFWGKGTFVWEPYDSSEDESEDDDERQDVYYMLDVDFYSRRDALLEEQAQRIGIRRELLEEKRKTTGFIQGKQAEAQAQTRAEEQAQTGNKPRRAGRLFCLVKGMVSIWYCKICKKLDDHLTIHCPTTGDPVHCQFCLKFHPRNVCPYRNYVPKGAELGPKAMLVCKCCGQEDGHPDDDDDWVGIAVYVHCFKCGVKGDHKTKDCPVGYYDTCWYCRRKNEHQSYDCPEKK